MCICIRWVSGFINTIATCLSVAGRNETERIPPDNLQLKQTPQAPTTNGSNTNGSGQLKITKLAIFMKASSY